MGVADLAAFNGSNDGHAGAQFAGLRSHAEDTDVDGFERLQDLFGCFSDGTEPEVFQQEFVRGGTAVLDGRSQAGGYRFADGVGDQGNLFAGTDGQAGFHGVFRAGH